MGRRQRLIIGPTAIIEALGAVALDLVEAAVASAVASAVAAVALSEARPQAKRVADEAHGEVSQQEPFTGEEHPATLGHLAAGVGGVDFQRELQASDFGLGTFEGFESQQDRGCEVVESTFHCDGGNFRAAVGLSTEVFSLADEESGAFADGWARRLATDAAAGVIHGVDGFEGCAKSEAHLSEVAPFPKLAVEKCGGESVEQQGTGPAYADELMEISESDGQAGKKKVKFKEEFEGADGISEEKASMGISEFDGHVGNDKVKIKGEFEGADGTSPEKAAAFDGGDAESLMGRALGECRRMVVDMGGSRAAFMSWLQELAEFKGLGVDARAVAGEGEVERARAENRPAHFHPLPLGVRARASGPARSSLPDQLAERAEGVDVSGAERSEFVEPQTPGPFEFRKRKVTRAGLQISRAQVLASTARRGQAVRRRAPEALAIWACSAFLKCILSIDLFAYFALSCFLYLACGTTITVLVPGVEAFFCNIAAQEKGCDNCPDELMMCEKPTCWQNAGLNLTYKKYAADSTQAFYQSYSKAALDTAANKFIQLSSVTDPLQLLSALHGNADVTVDSIEFHCQVLFVAIGKVEPGVLSGTGGPCTNDDGVKQAEVATECPCDDLEFTEADATERRGERCRVGFAPCM
ncbi:unnamed protein product [Prorocentrum cordatum]|uniref:Uncharacterized protein n=1 Tax=Prorocentrum cordatum TaxID=2364126 RepID=A0ABN9TQE5_9DINO|nr:unnamed protein product [Polarella glacialis]